MMMGLVYTNTLVHVTLPNSLSPPVKIPSSSFAVASLHCIQEINRITCKMQPYVAVYKLICMCFDVTRYVNCFGKVLAVS
jgi:hypothetical protein